MKEINIAKSIVTKRREKGITQDELAEYIGVSKASVSKWETGQSYPDIILLPQLAAYFNISIDELMSYSPQMTKEDIRKLYQRLSSDFAAKPFEDVIREVHNVIKKYYSCFPLLLQIVVLLVNHHMLTDNRKMQESLLQEAIDLCIRIKAEAEEVELIKDANSLEAICCLLLNRPQKVLELLGETIKPSPCDDESLAQAYYLLGNTTKANEVIQISMYQHLLMLMGTTPLYLMLNADNPEKSELILQRALAVAETFKLDTLHPNSMLKIYLSAAQVYSLQKQMDKALEMLERYTNLCISEKFAWNLHEDTFFDTIGGWLKTFDLGTGAPRNEKVIKENMLLSITSNPFFTVLEKEPGYKTIVESLKKNL